MKVIFVRHGHPDYKLDCLTELGHLQAEAAAERLKDEPICAVYSSSKGRAVETAEHIAKKQGLPVKERFDFMQELAWKPLEGMPELPHKGQPWFTVSDMVAAGQSVVNSNWQEESPFSQNPRLLAQEQPIGEAFDNLLREYGLEREGNYYRVRRKDDSIIVMASHAGASSMVLSHLFNLPFPFVIAAMSPNFTGITVVNFDGEEGKLLSPQFDLMNDARHIKDISTEVFFGN